MQRAEKQDAGFAGRERIVDAGGDVAVAFGEQGLPVLVGQTIGFCGLPCSERAPRSGWVERLP